MTADIVNLRRFRKEKARAGKEAEAAANRRRHGRSGAEKAAERLERERAERRIEAHRREPEDGEPDGS